MNQLFLSYQIAQSEWDRVSAQHSTLRSLYTGILPFVAIAGICSNLLALLVFLLSSKIGKRNCGGRKVVEMSAHDETGVKKENSFRKRYSGRKKVHKRLDCGEVIENKGTSRGHPEEHPEVNNRADSSAPQNTQLRQPSPELYLVSYCIASVALLTLCSIEIFTYTKYSTQITLLSEIFCRLWQPLHHLLWTLPICLLLLATLEKCIYFYWYYFLFNRYLKPQLSHFQGNVPH